MIPAAFEYGGTPTATAAGTDHHASAPTIPARMRRVLSGVKYDRMIPTPKTTGTSSISTLGAS